MNGKYIVTKPQQEPEWFGSESFVVSTFYKFCEINKIELFRDKVYLYCVSNNILGTILLAEEGINGTIACHQTRMEAFYEYLFCEDIATMIDLKAINFRESYAKICPFSKCKIRIKPEIVTFEQSCAYNPGQYIEPKNWDDFISREDVILVDTRNDYEVEAGTFSGAVNPKTNNFKDMKQWFDDNKQNIVGKKLAMFCTGGIRCEKSTSFAMQNGISEVYHLKGGIISYFLETHNKNDMWKGKCFVFDDRTLINDKLEVEE